VNHVIRKKRGGFTLLELIIALAIWTILTASVIQIVGYTSRSTARIIARQEAFENARVAVDSIVVNLQLADEIELYKDANYMLHRLRTRQDNTFTRNGAHRHWFTFMYDQYAWPGSSMYKLLAFADGGTAANALATGITGVWVEHSEENNWMTVTVTAGDNLDIPITLTGKVDVRYKIVEVTVERGLHT